MRKLTGFSRRTRTVPVPLVAMAVLMLAVGFVLAQGQAPPAGAAEGVRQQTTPRMSMLELLLKGRWFMLPIGACSLLGLAIIVERLVALRRTVVIPSGFLAGLKSVFRGDREDLTAGLKYCGANDCPFGRVAAAGIRKLHKGEAGVEQAIEDAGANEISKLRRNLRMLYGVAAVAPMLGLLGTVWGMIQAFQVTSQAGLGDRGEKLATGIYEALVTTFGGLIVAIPALIFYYHFLSKIDAIVHEMNEQSIEFVEHYILQGEATGAPGAGETA